MFRISSFRTLGALVLCILFLYFLFKPTSTRRGSPIQDDHVSIQRRENSLMADQRIYFLKPDSFTRDVERSSGIWLVFYSINECPFCQAFTPQWLKFQERLSVDRLPIHLAKFDCTAFGGEKQTKKQTNIFSLYSTSYELLSKIPFLLSSSILPY